MRILYAMLVVLNWNLFLQFLFVFHRLFCLLVVVVVVYIQVTACNEYLLCR